MKRQIRRGCFETNSSSMHSLVITKNDKYFTEDEVRDDIYIHDGIINLRHRDLYYGRAPFKILNSLLDKSKYVLASMCNYKNDDVYNEVCEVIKSYIPEFKDFDLNFSSETHSKKYYSENSIKKLYGEGNYVEKDDFWITWGYDLGGVDVDILTGFLKKENITITEFLKNKKYVVIVDGDEYCIYSDMKEAGLINKDNIVREYPEDDYDDGYSEEEK